MKRTVTFEVEPLKLFETIQAGGSDATDALGRRLVSILLAPGNSFHEAVGLAMYGVVEIGVDEVKAAPVVPDGAEALEAAQDQAGILNPVAK